MSGTIAVLAEPLSLGQQTIPHGTRCSGKVLYPCAMLIGFTLTVFFNSMPFTGSTVEVPAIDMFGTQLAKSSSVLASSGAGLLSARASSRPQFRADAIRGSSMQGFSAASPMSMTCPRPSGAATSVNAMQDTLQKYGIPSSPLVKFALTSFAATRDVSRAAQAKEEFSRLDPVTQAKFRKLSQDIVVKASSLKPEDMAGITKPLGFWDPAGLSKKGNLAVYRNAELKHGRVCMLAVLGIIVTEEFHPFFDFWGDGPFVSAAASHFSATAQNNFWPAFWVMAAGHEMATELNGGFNAEPKDRAPGDYGFDPLNLKPTDPAELKIMQNKEINNGRLAMVASAGILVQELITGKKLF